MAQTPYSMMAAYNRYTGGATSGSVVGTVSNFGSSMAGNPLAALGRFNMTAAGFASRSIEEGGLARTTDDLITMAKSGQFNGAINKNGKLDAGAAYQMLTASMGFTDQQAKAYLQAQQAAQDSGVAGQSGQALMNSWAETRQKLLEQQGIGSRGQRLVRPFYTRANEMQEATSKVIGKGLEKVGRGVDSLEKWWMGPEADDTNKLINGMAEEGLNTEFNYSGGDSDDQGVVRKLANNKDVIDAVKSKDSEAIRLAIQNEVDKGTIDSDYAKGAKLESLVTTLKGQGVKGPMTPAEQKAATEKMLLKVTGAHSVDKARDIISLGMKIHKQGDTFSKEDLERLSKDTDIKFSSANRDSAKSYLSVMAASYNGVTNTGDMGAMLSGLTSKATIQTGMDKLAQDLAQKIDFSGMKLDAGAMEVQATTVNITIGGETKTYNKDASSTKKASAPAFLRNMMQNP
jgi:hypothetical protein